MDRQIPFTESPLDAYRGSGPKPKPLAAERKKPGRKRKPVVPVKITVMAEPIVLTFD
jgi:hypothetical protein